MFWETLWPLVLGFGLSGAVQAFVSREQMQRRLGSRRPGAIARAGAYGMASSSCSYAASAMAKSLFGKGADFTTAMVFMFASTNLVVELGVVLVILMGWQFAAAEFVGGPIMILLLAVLGGVVFTPRVVAAARRRLDGATRARVDDVAVNEPSHADERAPRPGIRSLAGWSDAASFTISDLTMLRRELVIGYLVAGFLTVLVPSTAWNSLFVQGHGGWTMLENAVIGPVLAFVSFVCSIGNVPMAAALWKGGITFGGVVSFLFADLVAAPLVLVYWHYFGGRLTVRLVAVFWAVMACAGLLVGVLFSGAGLVPHRHAKPIAATGFSWNYTAYLNIAFLCVFAVLVLLSRGRERLGGGSAYARDPVCNMQVRTADAPASLIRRGRRIWFCSDKCAARFAAAPERYERRVISAPPSADEEEAIDMATDPICGMTIDPATAAAVRTFDGRNYFFCAVGCAETFDEDPGGHASAGAASSDAFG